MMGKLFFIFFLYKGDRTVTYSRENSSLIQRLGAVLRAREKIKNKIEPILMKLHGNNSTSPASLYTAEHITNVKGYRRQIAEGKLVT